MYFSPTPCGARLQPGALYPPQHSAGQLRTRGVHGGLSGTDGTCPASHRPAGYPRLCPPEKHTFHAQASAPLIIENYALGYRLQVLLLAFEENSNLNTLRYVVKTQFEEIAPENERQRAQFEKNRETTYRGSSRHFFKALQAQRARAEGFEVVGKEAFLGLRMQRTVPEGKLKDHDVYPINPDTLLGQTQVSRC